MGKEELNVLLVKLSDCYEDNKSYRECLGVWQSIKKLKIEVDAEKTELEKSRKDYMLDFTLESVEKKFFSVCQK